jgi:cold shock protein
MPTGIVKFYDLTKGYGFITRDEGGDDLFVHISRCDESLEALTKGQRVRFDEAVSKRTGKFEATNVALL